MRVVTVFATVPTEHPILISYSRLDHVSQIRPVTYSSSQTPMNYAIMTMRYVSPGWYIHMHSLTESPI